MPTNKPKKCVSSIRKRKYQKKIKEDLRVCTHIARFQAGRLEKHEDANHPHRKYQPAVWRNQISWLSAACEEK